MHLVGVADLKRYEESVDFWKNVYGYKMSCMKKVVNIKSKEAQFFRTKLSFQPSIREASVEVVSPATLITETVQIHEVSFIANPKV